jgi:hypothetical protein
MNALLWIVAHKALLVEVAIALGVAVSAFIGALPSSASKNAVVAALARMSALTHSDAPGTFKAPGAAMPATEAERLARIDADAAVGDQ